MQVGKLGLSTAVGAGGGGGNKGFTPSPDVVGVGSCSWLSSSLIWLKDLPERRWEWRGGTRTGRPGVGRVGPGGLGGVGPAGASRAAGLPLAGMTITSQAGLKGWEVGSP